MIDLNSLVTLNPTLGFAYGINSSSQRLILPKRCVLFPTH